MYEGKISVLIVDTAIDFGGSIVSTANLIRGLNRERFTVTFVTATHKDLVRNKLREAASDTRVVVVKKWFHYGMKGRVTTMIDRLPLKVLRKIVIYSLYLVRIVLNVPYALAMALLIRRFRVDLVQLNNAFGNDELDCVAILMRRPRIVFFRGYLRLSAIERGLFLSGARAFVSVSEFVKRQAMDDGVPGEKIIVATPPAIVEHTGPQVRKMIRRTYDVREDELVFGLFGRVVPWKGQKEFLTAARVVLGRVHNAKVFFVGDVSDGDSRYLTELKSLVTDFGMKDRVVFTGYVDRVYELYGIMDVVVHASIEPEPSGRVIFEAMSVGVPVVASCFGGPKEFVDDGVDGFIVDPRNADQMANRIVSLLEDKVLRTRMGVAAEEKMSHLYNKTVYARRIEQVYEGAIQ